MPIKNIILFRHAQKSFWSQDPDLSSQGHQQAKNIIELVQSNKLPIPSELLCSPKKRALQTFLPFKSAYQIQLNIETSLDERGSHESQQQFESRIKNFVHFDLPQKTATCLFLCTHLDWFEVFSIVAPLIVDLSQEVLQLQPASYYHFQIETNQTQPWSLFQKGEIQ